MLTIYQIVKKANRLRLEGAKYVRITDMKKGYDSQGRGFVACASYSTHLIGEDGKPIKNPHPHKYVSVITFLDRKLNVQVSCSCADFLYRWEVALHNKGAAEIEYSNGAFPTMTNPAGKHATCKHLISLYNKIKAKLPPPQ